jgi:predicted amidohydrolase YtcJ
MCQRGAGGPAPQEGDEVIDAGGGTVLPGLIDAHMHLVPGALAQSLTFGVTTVLDMFSTPDLVARAKEQAGSRPDVADGEVAEGSDHLKINSMMASTSRSNSSGTSAGSIPLVIQPCCHAVSTTPIHRLAVRLSADGAAGRRGGGG